MIAPLLKTGDTIGVLSPCHVARRETYQPILENLRAMGFRVRESRSLYSDTDGYLASVAERAADFNDFVLDDSVSMVFFGGGEGGCEIVPHLDFDAIAARPKLYASYSDGTSILVPITLRTGLETYYGQMPGAFAAPSPYVLSQFRAHLVDGNARSFAPSGESPWIPVREGEARGELTGGYLVNFALLCDREPFGSRDRVLFLEDHEQFGDVGHVSAFLTHVARSAWAGHIRGLLFGHYATPVPPSLLARLRRFGDELGIPVAYCDDFGHDCPHGMLPIGRDAALTVQGSACDLTFAAR